MMPQVRVTARCLSLHSTLCSAEMRSFHNILERFFRKNFADEIERLDMVDEPLDEAAPPSPLPHQLPYVQSSPQYELDPNFSPTTPAFNIGGTYQFQQVERHGSQRRPSKDLTVDYSKKNQTPLQRNLAHLARHGLNGVSSGPSIDKSYTLSRTDSRSDSMDGTVVTVANVGREQSVNEKSIAEGSIPRGQSRISRKLGSIVWRGKPGD